MFIIYRGLGLVWAFPGVLVLPLMFVVTGSL